MVDSPKGRRADANSSGAIGAFTCTVFLTRDSAGRHLGLTSINKSTYLFPRVDNVVSKESTDVSQTPRPSSVPVPDHGLGRGDAVASGRGHHPAHPARQPVHRD